MDQFASSVDQLVKALADGILSTFDQARVIGVMKSIEQRNRIPLMNHMLIGEAETRNLPDALTQPSLVRVLMSVLRLSPG